MPDLYFLRSVAKPALRFPLRSTISTIGRSIKCDVVIDDHSISRKHAQIRIESPHFFLTDLNSRNGTFIGDAQITSAQFMPGQVIKFADIALTLITPTSARSDASNDVETATTGDSPRPVSRLSAAQKAVFDLLIHGHSEKEIAGQLALSRHTIHNHVKAIYGKLNVHSRGEFLAMFVEAANIS